MPATVGKGTKRKEPDPETPPPSTLPFPATTTHRSCFLCQKPYESGTFRWVGTDATRWSMFNNVIIKSDWRLCKMHCENAPAIYQPRDLRRVQQLPATVGWLDTLTAWILDLMAEGRRMMTTPEPKIPACYHICNNADDDVAIHALTGAPSWQALLDLARLLFTSSPSSSFSSSSSSSSSSPPPSHYTMRECPCSKQQVPHLHRHSHLDCCMGRLGFTLMHIRKNLDFPCLNVLFGFNTKSGYSSEFSSHILDLIDQRLVKVKFWTDGHVLLPPSAHWDHTPLPFQLAHPHVVTIVDDTYILMNKFTKNFKLAPLIRSFSHKDAHFNLPIATTADGRPLTCGDSLWASDEAGNAALHHLLDQCGLGDYCLRVRALMLERGQIEEHEKVLLMLDKGYDVQCVPERFKAYIGVVTPDFGADPKGVLSTIEANRTRLVTKFRNVIEHFNRRFKEVRTLSFVLASLVSPLLVILLINLTALPQPLCSSRLCGTWFRISSSHNSFACFESSWHCSARGEHHCGGLSSLCALCFPCVLTVRTPATLPPTHSSPFSLLSHFSSLQSHSSPRPPPCF
jgi:hypothetical protein